MVSKMVDFKKKLEGKRVSIMILGKTGKKETYNGSVEVVDEKFLVMKSLPSDQFEIAEFIIKLDLILSVWIYK